VYHVALLCLTCSKVMSMKTLAVTGIGSDLGCRFLKLVDDDPNIQSVIGIDVKEPAFQSSKLEFRKLTDLSKPYDAIFADNKADVAIFLGLQCDSKPKLFERNVSAFQQFINAASVAGCQTVTIVSSIAGYGAHEDNLEVLYEGSLLRPTSEFGRSVAEIEKLCYGYVHTFPTALLQILRPAYVVGPKENNFLTRALKRRILLVPSDAELAFQFVFVEDVARALHCLLDSDCVGIFNLAADSALTIEQVAQLAERRLIRVPDGLLKVFMAIGGLFGIKNPPWFEKDAFSHSKHSILVANVKFRHEVYFDFMFSSPEAYLESLLKPLASDGNKALTFAEELFEDDIEAIDFLTELSMLESDEETKDPESADLDKAKSQKTDTPEADVESGQDKEKSLQVERVKAQAEPADVVESPTQSDEEENSAKTSSFVE
jgi:UDP-glucose 4-epimerase